MMPAVGGVPTAWVSTLGRLESPLPPDRTPANGGGRPIQVRLPLPLARQSISPRDEWPIPEPVREAYTRYRPTPLWRATRFEQAIGARVPIYVKYEGENISGSHKLNTAIAQAHYYAASGARELVAGTGAGQWGTALAAACAMFGLRCTVFMVGGSLRKKPYRASLMRLLGATVHASPSEFTAVGRAARGGPAGNELSLAIGEATEHAAATDGAAFATGSGETYSIVHQSVLGLEAMEQLPIVTGAGSAQDTVDTVVAPIGAGSGFGGIALPWLVQARRTGTEGPRLVAAESAACPTMTQGVYAWDHTDATRTGPMEPMYTLGLGYPIPDGHAGGLRYHGASKLISALYHRGDVEAVDVEQREALEAGRLFAVTESVLPAPESGHALAAAARFATGTGAERSRRGVLACVSGHGYLDLAAYDLLMSGGLADESVPADRIRMAVAGLDRVDGALAGR